jgi:hypothetical protein
MTARPTGTEPSPTRLAAMTVETGLAPVVPITAAQGTVGPRARKIGRDRCSRNDPAGAPAP